MRKFLLSAFVLGVFALYAVHLRTDTEEHPVVTINSPLPTSQPTIVPTPIAASNGPTPVPTATPQGKYKDGSYTGDVADAFYGNIQVQAIISGGKIIDVKFLQYPNDRGTSREINAQADPMLTQEAIQAQSAQVSGVSGATASSGAFVQSLQSALQQAM